MADLSTQIRSVILSPDALSSNTNFLMREPLLSRHMRSSDTSMLMHILMWLHAICAILKASKLPQ